MSQFVENIIESISLRKMKKKISLEYEKKYEKFLYEQFN